MSAQSADIDLLGIVGSPGSPSKTRAAVQVALDAAQRAQGGKTAIVQITDDNLDEALALIVRSRAFLIGTPVYRAAYTGELKRLLDRVPRGGRPDEPAPLANRAVGLVATGATPHHFLSVDHELRPLLAFFGAHVVGGSVYAHAEHFHDSEIVDEGIRARLEKLGVATLDLSRAIDASASLSTLGPQL